MGQITCTYWHSLTVNCRVEPALIFLLYFKVETAFFLERANVQLQILTLFCAQLVPCTDHYYMFTSIFWNILCSSKQFIVKMSPSLWRSLLSITKQCWAWTTSVWPIVLYSAVFFYMLKSIKHLISPTKNIYNLCTKHQPKTKNYTQYQMS